ncbi:MAG: hypothetical protein D6797_03665 [Bdellovibrio sp.]|nr:MAG: hypothetical protein D6797_03665 [Bdellovibrio sp.]
MYLPFIFLLIFSSINHLDLHNFLAEKFLFIHNHCIQLTPFNSPWQWIYRSLLCGSSSPSNISLVQSMKTLGLYHLLVISGLHILSLEKAVSFCCRRNKALTLLSLFIFCLACQMRPPVTRAFLALLINYFQKQRKLFWSPVQRAWATGCLTLFLFPEWWSSFSFLLSWAASLLISLPIKRPLIKITFLYLGLQPLLLSFSPLSPLSILINWALTPLWILWVLPMSLLGLVPPLSPYVDKFWESLNILFSALTDHFFLSATASPSLPFSLSSAWIYLFLLFLTLGLWEILWKKPYFSF